MLKQELPKTISMPPIKSPAVRQTSELSQAELQQFNDTLASFSVPPPVVAPVPEPIPEPPPVPELVISDEDRKNFAASVLGERLFSKTYPLFGGKWSVAFTELSAADADRIDQTLEQALVSKRLASDAAWQAERVRLRAAVALAAVTNNDVTWTPKWADKETLDEAVRCLKRATGTEVVYKAVLQAYENFDAILQDMAGDPDFFDTVPPPTS
jgi:hypothetical protein